MNAATAYKFYHAYKLFYSGKYDPTKYRWNLPNLPALEKQPDRHFFNKLAHRLNDAEIHALYTVGFFHKVNAYIADLMTPDMLDAGIRFASRAQNGRPQLEADLYDLTKKLDGVDLDAWLYGEVIDGQRAMVPGVLQMVIDKELELDVAALLLLVPQPHLEFNWLPEMLKQPSTMAFGPISTPKKLQTADRLIKCNRPGWRLMSQQVAAAFWESADVDTLAPASVVSKRRLF